MRKNTRRRSSTRMLGRIFQRLLLVVTLNEHVSFEGDSVVACTPLFAEETSSLQRLTCKKKKTNNKSW